ncbi:MAG: NADPH-dependent 7-cyano-7-deazaguanine reductase QueF [Akkermansiaceae bacterium]|nr:NADPH-dependent 7-cyano-7-deazaguanine reductase QueF [Akkermansiaceae bacterium]
MNQDLTLLGKHSAFFTSPDEAKLEAFPNRSPQRPYIVELDTHEFSSLCPVTGQPDSCHLTITYSPADKVLETKSLKYYLVSFRNFPAFNEQVVNRILDDLVAAVQPRWMKVEGRFGARGGIRLTTIAEHQPENRPR